MATRDHMTATLSIANGELSISNVVSGGIIFPRSASAVFLAQPSSEPSLLNLDVM
jgi:hypothetical protein